MEDIMDMDMIMDMVDLTQSQQELNTHTRVDSVMTPMSNTQPPILNIIWSSSPWLWTWSWIPLNLIELLYIFIIKNQRVLMKNNQYSLKKTKIMS